MTDHTHDGEDEYTYYGDASHDQPAPPLIPPTQHEVDLEGSIFHEVVPAPNLKMHVSEEAANDRRHVWWTIILCLITVILTLLALLTLSLARYSERQGYNHTIDALIIQVNTLKHLSKEQSDTIREQDNELTCRAGKQADLAKANAASGKAILNLIVLEAKQRYAELQHRKGNPAALGEAIRESDRSLKAYDKANRVYQQEIQGCLTPQKARSRPGG